VTQGAPDAKRELRSYGRRRGRARSERQQALWRDVLPRLALPRDQGRLLHLAPLFTPAVGDVWLEIGFGGGEHLLALAAQRPDVGFIGCEPFEDGVVKVLSAVETGKAANIRLWPDDARPLLRLLPPASIGRTFILFPDPWPKKRHHKRRLISGPTLGELARVMRAGAELRVATDIGDYACAILLAVGGHDSFRWTATGPGDWRRRPPDWPPTRYEAKAVLQGRRCYFFRFERV
jgi:tRNA (guanine-N7-)-methyltransferase